ncbi:MAG TPA: DUF4396 domain-containing protein [Candidatus Saccharimonadia bacterium]|nr:DUF4396 domain-containing protein [Candidatus Saccharimonadia bacterium]
MLDRTTKLAVTATTHCLIGCGLGETLGMVITNAPHRKVGPAIIISVMLAFVMGYSLTLWPLLRQGLGHAVVHHH